jgi:hypothetical protein
MEIKTLSGQTVGKRFLNLLTEEPKSNAADSQQDQEAGQNNDQEGRDHHGDLVLEAYVVVFHCLGKTSFVLFGGFF